MTLIGKKFSNEKKNIIRHDIGFILGKNGWIFLVGTAVFMVLIPFFTAGLPGDSIFDIEVTHDQLKFRLINENIFTAVMAVSVIMGLMTGSCIFRFVQDKKETTIFFSMGMTRTQIFINRMSVAFSMLAVMTAVPMLLSVILNVSALGMYQALIRNALFLWAGLFLMASVSCVVSVIMCFISGSLMELMVYWICGMSAPTVLCLGFNMLMKKLYWGNAWGVTTYSGAEQIRESLLEKFSFLNPILFFKNDLASHSQFMRPLSTDVPEDVSWIVIAGWFAALIIMTAAAWWLLRCWKAENSGITGNNRLMAEMTAAFTGFIVVSFVVSYLFDSSVWLSVAAGLAAFAATHMFWKKAGIFGSVKKRSQFISALLQASVIAVICVVFSTGFFGGTERFIKKSEVAQVKVNYTGDPSCLYEEATGSSTGHGYYVVSHLKLEDIESINKTKDLHMMFQQSGRKPMKGSDNPEEVVIPYDISFSYIEEDGTERTWYYDRASYGQLESMLEIENLSEVKSGQKGLFEASDSGSVKVLTKQAYDVGTIYITDPYLSETYELTLGEDMRRQLLKAIGEDMSQMTLDERYFPEESTEAVLMFSQTGEDDSKYFAYHLDNTFLYLTSRYKNTLKWLEENELLQYVKGEQKIESITLQRMNPYIGINIPDYPMGMYFMSYFADSSDDFMIQKDFGNKYVIDDPDKIQEVTAGLRNGYYMSRGGYLAAVKLDGQDGYRYMFLPEIYVPDFVRK